MREVLGWGHLAVLNAYTKYMFSHLEKVYMDYCCSGLLAIIDVTYLAYPNYCLAFCCFFLDINTVTEDINMNLSQNVQFSDCISFTEAVQYNM